MPVNHKIVRGGVTNGARIKAGSLIGSSSYEKWPSNENVFLRNVSTRILKPNNNATFFVHEGIIFLSTNFTWDLSFSNQLFVIPIKRVTINPLPASFEHEDGDRGGDGINSTCCVTYLQLNLIQAMKFAFHHFCCNFKWQETKHT